MDAWDVLRALQAGTISVDDAKKQLALQQATTLAPAPTLSAAHDNPGEHYGLVLSTVHHLHELAWREWVVPEPGADEMTIRVYASAINFPDTMCVHGLYPTMPDYPFVPGFEIAGRVSRVGRRDAGFREGDEVIALTGPRLGGHAAQVNVSVANVVHKPANISFADACSLPVVFGTMSYAFAKGGLAAGEHVLIQTATGGCGLLALQLAHLQGCICYGTSSREEKLQILKRLGVAHAVNYKTTEFDREIRRLTHNRGVDVVLNMLSGDGIQRGLNCLAPAGRYVEIAVHALKASKPLDLSKLVQNQTFHSIDLRQPGLRKEFSAPGMLATMVAMLQEERIVPIVSRVYPLHRIREALAYVGEGRHIGKVVISHTAEDMVDRTEQCIQGLLQQKRRAEAERASTPAVTVMAAHAQGGGADLRLQGIAIIGIAGQFPMAPTVADFWDNVARGQDCISEIPPGRWPLDLFYDADPKALGKTYSKWMGVLEDIDKFDPLFFSITPAEAELMDPQQRLFLENCWHCIEDAGLSPTSLSGQRCGVFAGCAPSDYGQFTGTGGLNAQGLLGGATSILSARISYLLNLKGPCLSIDTACSSSLVAIAEACNSLILHDCDLALAGGVCIMPGPGAHIMTSKAGMLSRDGRCFTFDQRANGFVPGEGVGVVLLKRRADAVRDGDPIYGVIRGWGVNQDGKTNGITAPSVTSQISLETEVYRRFALHPSSISLVEAHGTGTKLGDPIEVEALTESFRAFTRAQGFCALGSVKSNIGHLLAAAGVSGLIKVLMALQQKMLPPTIHFDTLNEHINLEDSPFYINTQLKPWPGTECRAAVSTFGFSGTNAHIVVEEFVPPPETVVSQVAPGQPLLFLLSARTAERLAAYATLLQGFVTARPALHLRDVAYTLQVGRQAMEHRLALCADSRQALLDGLAAFTALRPAASLLVGKVRKNRGGAVLLDGDTDSTLALQAWCEALASADPHALSRQTARLAALWVQGVDVDWQRLYDVGTAGAGRSPRRISLPGYPFARERHWIPDLSHLQAPRPDTSALLHPLIHRNTSTFFEQRFSSTFSGKEFYLADHVINGRRLLPGVAYLEMASAALRLASGDMSCPTSPAVMRFTDVVWLRPIVVGLEPVQVHIRLLQDEKGLATFEVYSEVNDETVVHSQGTVVPVAEHEMEAAPRLDLPTLQAQCNRGHLSAAWCYQAFHAMNMTYGPGHQGIDALYLGMEHGAVQVLARLNLPAHLHADFGRFTLHPCLLDAALQAAIGLSGCITGEVEDDALLTAAAAVPALPFALELVDIFGPCTATMWALLREASAAGGMRKLHIDLCDEAGEVRLRLRGYMSRLLEEGGKGQGEASPAVISFAEPRARRHPLIDADVSSAAEQIFTKCFSNRDFILRDHVFDGVRVLPAAAIIEMAREAAVRTGARPRQLTNFLVGYPIVGTEAGIDTRLVLKPVGNRIDFILSSRDSQRQQDLVHSQGTIEIGTEEGNDDAGTLDLEALRARLPQRADLQHDYDTVVPHAAEFGPALRTLREFYYGEREALSKIVVGEESRDENFMLHPLIIDGAFQAGAVAYYYQRQGFQPGVLFSIDRLEILAPTGHTCYVHLTLLDSGHGNTMAFDANICNEAGRIVARLVRVTIKLVTLPQSAPALEHAPASEEQPGRTDLWQKTEAYLKAAIARVVKIPADRLESHENFGTYGIDSLTIMHLNDLLGEDFHALPRTLFFEYITVYDLTAYFVAHHATRLEQLLLQPAVPQPAALPAERTRRPHRQQRFARPVTGSSGASNQERAVAATRQHDVAIIGLAGRYPGAERLEQFWENLKLGRDCVTEIPATAWDYRALYDPQRQRQHSIYGKWGGFIKDADKFDPLFFHISPLEAETMDPQARLFLETAWHCVEDAGYAPRSFASLFSNRNVGVFVGVSTNEYQLLKLPSADIDLYGVAYLFAVANRVSYHLGLHGPSISVDTACSSSLSAMHMACKSIIHGECEAAIAGGVNLSLHPHKYQYLSKGNFLASDGRCRSFGAGGDGYVPGEGVGAVLLKPLQRAMQDGDHIYGVIKGSAMNHGGKTSGFTVPNPKAQARLIQDALHDAGVDPRTITYLEAHGTGTELGDPIEIAGLAEAFLSTTVDRQFCAIGSCKSNIGHLEAAAGMAQLTKVLLQMRHRQLVPSIHTSELNPNIDFANTPFYVQRELSPWEPLVLQHQGAIHASPRRAGISSFGVGGANAHLIVEAYEPLLKSGAMAPRQPQLLVLSATNEERLRVYAGDIAAFLLQSSNHPQGVPESDICRDLMAIAVTILKVSEADIDAHVELSDLGFDAVTLSVFVERLNAIYNLQPSATLWLEYPTLAALAGYLNDEVIKGLGAGAVGNELDLRDLAYTLQTGREPLEERLAVIVSSVTEAVDVLRRFCAAEPTIPALYRGNARKDKVQLPADDVVAALLHNRALSALARLWVCGWQGDWRLLYGEEQPARLSLPTYPFARERYWLPQGEAPACLRPDSMAVEALHPLLQRNTSDFSGQRFSSSFSGQEFFLAHHRLQGQRLLPAVAYLEMARAAVALAHGGLATGMRLRNVVWARPFVIVEAQGAPAPAGSAAPNQIHIGLSPQDNGTIRYEIYGEPEQPGDEPPLYSQGYALVSTADKGAAVPALDLATLRQQCDRRVLSAEVCYQACKAAGIDYGPGHRGIAELYLGSDLVLARLRLPAAVAHTQDSFLLHPSLLDGALQAAIGLVQGMGSGDAERPDSGPETRPALPFALEELELLAPCSPDMWAVVRYSDGSGTDNTLYKLDIDLCDDQGNLCVSLRGLSCKALSATRSIGPSLGTLMMAPTWRQSDPNDAPLALPFSRHLVIFCEPDDLSGDELAARMAGTDIICFVSSRRQTGVAARFQAHLARVCEEVQAILQARPAAPVLVQVVVPGTLEEQGLFAAISSLLKTAHLENPNLVGQVIEVRENFATWCNHLIGNLQENRQRCRDSHVLYGDGKRLVASWERLAALPGDAAGEPRLLPWKDDGVYLISGGAGGLGWLFAEEIARRTKRVSIILTGRAPLAGALGARLAGWRLRFPHATIDYRQADVAHEDEVIELVQWIRRTFGNLHGIIHGAGVLRDNFLLKKSLDEVHAVLAPKVAGLVHLDQASRDCDLDYLLLCSSGAAAEGNAGQADYAAANAFMDAYAAYRNRLVDTGHCRGRTLAVNWPLWQEGGMQVDQQTEDLLLRRMGMVPMTTAAGFRALYWSLASGRDQIWVLEGDLERLQALFESGARAAAPTAILEPVGAADGFTETEVGIASGRTRDKAIAFFRGLLAAAIKLPVERIEADVPFEHYGFDSILVVQLTNQLEKTFGPLSKTLLFDYQNIAQLTAYFLQTYPDKLLELLGIQPQVPVAQVEKVARSQPHSAAGKETPERRERLPLIPAAVAASQEVLTPLSAGPLDIAIIGLAGRYPMADSIDAFWTNLQEGRDCITEIPPERWNHHFSFDQDGNKPGKTSSKWGGFLNQVDCFDPLFFNISPREAEMLDPQERLFLECVYEAIEDAGYTRASLAAGTAERHPGAAAPVGVYVGVMYEEYQLYGAEAQARGKPLALLGSPSSIANRVSYFFNFNGPSLAVDTMCSSSLTAIHLACESLQRGDCQLAIAGGVNISIHPNKYLLLGQGHFVSSTGRCESFGAGGDGYVPGEGVGALLLKPLRQAIAGGDQIYGIIKSSAINHGGKTNGYSVPNPHAQAQVISAALQRAGIHPRTVSYVEAHGTGTSLGDPIEISALTRAFGAHTGDRQFCAIGSVKSNIGHCESAAGIAGVTKVLLQLKHRRLVPSLHSGTLNPNIDFANSPFTVPQCGLDWQRPIVATSADGDQAREYPRIAGVSSFGAGGSNAHVVIAEYIADASAVQHRSSAPALILLSAKNEEQLRHVMANVHRLLTGEPRPDLDLAALAYTLQVGREAMETRLALMVHSSEELAAKLAAILAGHQDDSALYRGTAGGTGRADRHTVALFAADEDLRAAIEVWIAKGKYEQLLSLWVQGLHLDWQCLYGPDTPHGTPPQRISLPTYPFDRQRYWAPELAGDNVPLLADNLHPLLHRNTSDLAAQRFSTRLSGREFFLADHLLQGQAVLPGVAYLEMARAALEQAARVLLEAGTPSPMVRLEQVVWARPVVVDHEGLSLHIVLFPEEPPQQASAHEVWVAYEIYSDSEAQRVMHGRGHAVLGAALPDVTLDLASLQACCDRGAIPAAQCYAAFAALGLDYGPAHRAIDVLYLGPDQVLARLCLPPSVADTHHRFGLHPSLLDGALQAAIGLYLDHSAHASRLTLPFAVEHVAILGPCTPVMWAHIRHASGATEEGAHKSGLRTLDIDLCDEDGLVRVRLRGLASRTMAGALDNAAESTATGTLLLQPHRRERAMLGDKEETRAMPTMADPKVPGAVHAVSAEPLVEKTASYFKELFAAALKLPVSRIRADQPLEQYGIDSVMVMELTGLLEQTFGPLSKTLFFEYQDIQSLSHYFVDVHSQRLSTLFAAETRSSTTPAVPAALAPGALAPPNTATPGRPLRSRFALAGTPPKPPQTEGLAIAIIGLAGRYPGARNMWEYWENLRAGKDSISEIPRERWNHDLYFDADRYKPGKTYSKWGGFLDGVTEFDPLFFNISPREAELMDPQERLFLQCVFAVLEDAGYTRESLARYQNLGLQGNVGVYVGVMYEEYQLYGAQETLQGRPLALSGSPSSIANRVSYFCNFHGPSMAVDTMCSSSLTTIHLACESLIRGGCELAVAGGVNVSIHPNKYIGLGQGQFVSSQGRCASFGEGGDGYVPGEGVGAVLLKPLNRAIADGDHIYGVIKGTAINHGGKTNGYAVPNPNAQANVIGQVFKQTGIDPGTISYLEAHGTGTSLGDPIEITGLIKAFREYTPANQFCAIGSVKSNIGHCESAAGIAGVSKILLQLKHRQLVPSLHAETLNPHIDFANSPFVVQRSLAPWQRPQRAIDPQHRPDALRELPRLAGISSFGAGGSNAHVIIEEYVAAAEVSRDRRQQEPYMIVLSAKNDDRLREMVVNLHQALTRDRRYTDADLAAMAYTLQVGREAMAERLAFLAASIEEMAAKLQACLALMSATDPQGVDEVDGLFRGRAGGGPREALTVFAADDELQAAVEQWIQRKKYAQLLRLWVQGMAFDWHTLYGENRPYGRAPRRISLPTYPFARQSYWVPLLEGGAAAGSVRMTSAAAALQGQTVGADGADGADASAARPPADRTTPLTPEQLLDRTTAYFKDLLASVLKISADLLEADMPMEDFGMDSVMVMQVTNHLEKTFGSLPKTLFFEYQNLQALSAYFVKDHGDALAQMFGTAAGLSSSDDKSVLATPTRAAAQPGRRWLSAVPPLDVREPGAEPSQSEWRTTGPLDIAIIGLAGRYPGANTMAEFWQNLHDGKDCISEIPRERWDYSRYVHGETHAAGKWGGFLDGVDRFDALFFNISPLEAEYMDPQERLFLECAYAAIEDAGYTRASLAAGAFLQQPGTSTPVGVFVGVMSEEYQLYGAQEQARGRTVALSGMSASSANRVSYFCNFHGPSLAVNTMCSSSLTSIHLACQSLKLGECELAIAGGVNLSIHPNKYLGLAQGKFLSSTGRCQVFGEGGDGYVPGEGVGAVVLKPLAQAIASGDHIYGIIKGSAVNHGGKANGYTTPNPTAQADVINRALAQAAIDPRTLSYLEAHGTGTALGDPIEMTALTRAMRAYTADQRFCAIGSVKSNIGHCEGAAGIAGLTKILLQLKHRQLVPSLHAETLHPNIDFAHSPFVVQRQLAAWERPVLAAGDQVREYPRLAGISSFGAGGSNAHLIIEEYIAAERPLLSLGDSARTAPAASPAVLVLSAKNEERLQEQARQLLAFLATTGPAGECSLADIAYTLQVGREAMSQRLAFLATSCQEVVQKLSAYVQGARPEGLFLGRTTERHGGAAPPRDGQTQQAVQEEASLETWLASGALGALLASWVQGMAVDWRQLYDAGRPWPQRLSLPTYPFARQRYWVPGLETGEGERRHLPSASAERSRTGHTGDHIPGGVALVPVLHPMLHRNTSTLAAQRFSTTFTGREFFLTDHVVQGRPVLPAVAYLEMARIAAVLATAEAEEPQARLGVRLRNVVWVQPLVGGEGEAGRLQVHLNLFPADNGQLDYEICSKSATGASTVHSRGCVVVGALAPTPPLDLAVVQAACSGGVLNAAQCYQAFRATGIDYGPAHQAIETLYRGSDRALAKLVLPAGLADSRLLLHPSLVDAALQATIGLTHDPAESTSTGLALPFALDEIEVHDACTATMWAVIRDTTAGQGGRGIRKLDIDLCDESGVVRMRMKGLSFRLLPRTPSLAAAPATAAVAQPGALMLAPHWQARDIRVDAAAPEYTDHLAILCELRPEWSGSENGRREASAIAVTPGMRRLSLHATEDTIDTIATIEQRFHTHAMQVFEEIRRMLASRPRGKVLVQLVVSHRGEARLGVGLAGLLRTASLENPNVMSQVIEVDEHTLNLPDILQANARCPGDHHVAYRDGARLVASWRQVEADLTPGGASRLPWRHRGVYLITGGAGGLGLIFAEEIVQRVREATVILAGRSAPDAHTQMLVDILMATGAPGSRVEYRRLDVGQRQAVAHLVHDITTTFGGLHGILHSAGVTRDNFLLNKDARDLAAVLTPKVDGCVHLDQACPDLDFFVLFSSLTGVMGNPGQADYAAANAFMDAYAHYRNTLVRAHRRRGHTLSINWPLWREGGMHVEAGMEQIMEHHLGLVPMATTTGLAAFYHGLALGAEQVLVVEGDPIRLRQWLGLAPTAGTQDAAVATPPAGRHVDEASGVRQDGMVHLPSAPSDGAK